MDPLKRATGGHARRMKRWVAVAALAALWVLARAEHATGQAANAPGVRVVTLQEARDLAAEVDPRAVAARSQVESAECPKAVGHHATPS